jgi:hypothetical protein
MKGGTVSSSQNENLSSMERIISGEEFVRLVAQLARHNPRANSTESRVICRCEDCQTAIWVAMVDSMYLNYPMAMLTGTFDTEIMDIVARGFLDANGEMPE